MGRPTKLTPQRQEEICRAIAEGSFLEPACQAAGVHYATLRNWLNRGREEGEGIFFEFFEAVTRAELEAERKAVRVWTAAVNDGDWRAARDFLRCRFGHRWNPPQRVAGHDGGPVGHTLTIEQATAEGLERGKVLRLASGDDSRGMPEDH